MWMDGLESYLRFTFWFVPVAGVLAVWKVIELAVWVANHVSVR